MKGILKISMKTMVIHTSSQAYPPNLWISGASGEREAPSVDLPNIDADHFLQLIYQNTSYLHFISISAEAWPEQKRRLYIGLRAKVLSHLSFQPGLKTFQLI